MASSISSFWFFVFRCASDLISVIRSIFIVVVYVFLPFIVNFLFLKLIVGGSPP
jgi:hypothetical protein